MADIDERAAKVRDAMHEAGKDLSPEDWIALCEIIETDAKCFGDAAREEMEDEKNES